MERPKQIKVPTVQEVMGRNPPEKKFRAGAIAATIWSNESIKDGKKISYKSVSFERHYKDKDGEWKSTNSLRPMDIPKAVLVMNKAYEYLVLDKEQIDEEEFY